MRFVIKHEIKGRIRIHVLQDKMTCMEADTLQYYLSTQKYVVSAKVHEQVQNVIIHYVGDREVMVDILRKFHYQQVEMPEVFLQNSGRELNNKYWGKLVDRVVLRVGSKLFLPYPVRVGVTVVKSIGYMKKGIKTLMAGKVEVPVLDGTAIGISLLRGNIDTAGSIMFLLGIGEILEEWTHKKSVEDLARSMSLNVGRVWKVENDHEILVSVNEIKTDDQVIVRMGSTIPFDGTVVSGEAMVNQASLTGEGLPVCKNIDGYVYAGTVIEEGELCIKVKEATGSSRFEKIVTMIEESEKLKSSVEGKAEHLADKLVPYTLAGAGLVWLFTGNVTKAVAVLLVDFSCALKLAMPISVLSAIREASLYHVTVKGGKYLEAVAEADTIVFDKTGTLTKAQPTVVDVIPFNETSADELLRIAACMEEHFPHSMARAVVDAAKAKHQVHDEMHSKVEYIVAHGISTMIEDQKVIIGSRHFVFEDEGCVVPPGREAQFEQLPVEYSHLYLAIEHTLAAVICIADPVRKEAEAVINSLRKSGIKKIVMMTGDNEHTARAIAAQVGVDEYYAEVLPEEKARFVEREKAAGRKVIMIGDGINDSPALAAADVGIAISDGAQIAREIADITIGADDLYEILTLKAISNALMKRIQQNYRVIVGFNAGLIVLGVGGVIQPTFSALLHNLSTLCISLNSMRNLLSE